MEIQARHRLRQSVFIRKASFVVVNHPAFLEWLDQVGGLVDTHDSTFIKFDSEHTAIMFMLRFPDLGTPDEGTHIDTNGVTIVAGGQVRIKLGVF